MSVATEVSRIQSARNSIRTKMTELGVTASTDTLDQMATKISAIYNRGAIDAEVKEGETYTIPAGYHNGSGTVSGVAGGGNYTLQSKTVTPSAMQQEVVPDAGKYGLSSVTVNPIPSSYTDVSGTTATAADVLTSKVFIDAGGVSTEGTMPNNGAISSTIDGLTTISVTVPAGYTSGGTVSLTNDIETALAAI